MFYMLYDMREESFAQKLSGSGPVRSQWAVQ